MNLIDRFLNPITMYRLVVYGLCLIAAAAFVLSGRLHFSIVGLATSLAILLLTSYATTHALGKVWRVPTNSESWLISALILFLILLPAHTATGWIVLATAGVIASASKYLLAWHGKHIFNPAAFAAAYISLTGLGVTAWWVGSSALWPLTLIVGLLVVRKIRRFMLVLTFAVVAIGLQSVLFLVEHQPFITSMKHALISSPLIFLATIMLTEPATMPPRRQEQLVFGAGLAVLYVTAWRFGPLVIYPEVALLLGNIYAFFVSPKFRLRLTLQEVQKISERVYHYSFTPDRRVSFLPGQYFEWTLPKVPFDSRGNRRTFTIASSPTEDTIQLGVKYYDPPSTFKHTLSQLEPGDTIYASQLAGNFTLEGDESTKLAFIAGGIGITPFRSMVKYIVDQQLQCDIVLIYSVADTSELAYHDIFLAARPLGLRFVPITTQPDYDGKGFIKSQLDAALIKRAVPDYSKRLFYISGPNAMVDATKKHLRQLGVGQTQVHTDHFSGY